MTILGIILLVFALGIFIFKKVVTPTPQDDIYGFYQTITKTVVLYTLLAVGVLLTLLTSVFYYNPPGTLVAVQYLWGGDNKSSGNDMLTLFMLDMMNKNKK